MDTDHRISGQVKHLYSRAAFGLTYPELQKLNGMSIQRVVARLFEDSEEFSDLQNVEDSFHTGKRRSRGKLSEEEKKDKMRAARQNVRQLNTIWLEKMATSPAQLREKLTLFWHGHFACRSTNAAFLQQLNNIHRRHALGNFRDLLLEVSRSPAMLQFLNNQQNRKDKPNENSARELMELFTLGHGQYTEADIKEAARAFTGWGYNQRGEFQFRSFLHDEGQKTFFGRTGNLDGTDIIDRILEKPEAAIFIARKLYAFMVSDTIDETRVSELGMHFFKSGYDISALVKKMLTSGWFYDARLIGSKIKSPVELLVGINRQFDVQYEVPEIQLKLQSALGQVLFYPPNVAGWSGGKNWIDSSSLMVRLKIPSLLLNAGIIDFVAKSDIEDEAIIASSRFKKQVTDRLIRSTPAWEKFLSGLPKRMPVTDLAAFLLQPAVSGASLLTLQNNQNLKAATIALLSLPEYQMC